MKYKYELKQIVIFLLLFLFSTGLQAQYSGYPGGSWINLPSPQPPRGTIYSEIWSTKDTDHLTVSNSLVKILKYYEGKAYVQCEYYYSYSVGNYEQHTKGIAYYDISCNPVSITGIPTGTITMKVGETKDIHWYFSPNNVDKPKLKWRSTYENVVWIEENYMNVVLHAKSAGTTNINIINESGLPSSFNVVVDGTSDPKLKLSASQASGEVAAGTIVTLFAEADGSTVSSCDIYYTTNETTPSKNNGKKYSSGITINSACTLKAIAYKSGYEDSDVLTVKYTIKDESKPKLVLSASPSGGQVSIGTTVSLSAKADGSTVSGCDIYYTTNETTPSKSNGTKYSSGITINSTCTLKAIAYKDGYEDSDVLTVDYTVRDDLASGDGSLSNPFNAVAATKKAGELGVGETSSQNYYVKGKISSIKYTYSAQYGTATFYISDDGTTNDQFYVYGSYYLENKPWVEGNPQIEIGDAVIVYGKMTNYNGILEMADKQNYVYSHNGKTIINTTPNQKLVLSAYPGGREVAAGTTVTLTVKANDNTVSGCDIYYTTNGTTPSKSNGTKYSSGITINSDCTLKAIAYKDGYETSDVLKEDYTIETVDGGAIVATCAGVKAGEDGHIYRVTGKVKSINDIALGWWYMEDSTGEIFICGTKSENSPYYAISKYGIEIGDIVTIEGSKATEDGQVELVDVRVISVNKNSPSKITLVASPSGGQVSPGSTVTLSTRINGNTLMGCDIYYTLNGTSPSKNNGSKYSYSITINESCTLKAIAYKDGFETSDVLTATYTVEQTPSNEYYYYVGNINGWNVLDATYYFTKMSDGKTWELTMPCDNIYLSNGNADEFKIGTVASLVDGWSVDVYGASDDNPSALRGTMSYINGPNFQVPFVEGMYSYTIRIVPSTMQYEIIVNRKESAEVVTATCTEVNAGTDGTIYRVTGNVKSISNTAYGNWYLEDSTGELFIYGTKDKEGNNGKNNSIDVWGIETSDIVTVEGPRQTYNGKVELVDVSILSLQKGKKDVIVVPANGNSSRCYATFYSSRSAYTLPNGLSAQVVTGENNNKLTYKTIADGSVSGIVPKGTAVMLVNDTKQAGTFSLTPTESNTSYSGINLLHGSDEPTTTTGDGYHYKLSYGPSGSQWSEVLGWYWGAQEGAPFQIDGRKAWLVVPKSYGARPLGFTIDGDAADVEINDSLQQIVDKFYDLQGRRINTPVKKGLYIWNGKKVVK